MICMLTFTVPTTSMADLLKAALKNFQELPLPDFVKRTGPYALLSEEGCKAYALIEIEKGKEEEGMEILHKRAFKYTPVKGYTQKVEIVLTMQEILSYIDLEAS